MTGAQAWWEEKRRWDTFGMMWLGGPVLNGHISPRPRPTQKQGGHGHLQWEGLSPTG